MKRLISAVVLVIGILAVTNCKASTYSVIKVRSAKMQKDIPVAIILPDTYNSANKNSTQKRFPVLYLLHGAGDTYAKWNRETPIAKLCDKYNIIVVCPDADRTSWYFDSPINPKSQYETFISKELVQFIDTHYRTLADGKFRAIAGISMGGHGALFLAIRHRNTFKVAVAMSGGVDIRPFANNWGIKSRIGSIKDYPQRWEKLTVINLAKTLKNHQLAISIDCGTSDFFLKVNRTLHAELLKNHINHEYSERPGSHGWKYWRYVITGLLQNTIFGI